MKAATNAAPSNRALALAFSSVRALEQFHARARGLPFHSLFYGPRKNLLQSRGTLRNATRIRFAMIISEKHAVQSGETIHNSLGLNYKSVALPLSYAGKNAARINARRRLKQVADLRNVSAL